MRARGGAEGKGGGQRGREGENIISNRPDTEQSPVWGFVLSC